IKWLFRGIHELARKNYDQPLRYRLNNQYVEVNPQEWRRRTNITVGVGTATGNKQQEMFALTQIGAMQEKMIAAGGLGLTVLPSNVYELAKDMAENLGENGEKYFFNPMLRQLPQVQQLIEAQMPQQGPDPQTMAIQATAEIEAQKVQQQGARAEMEAQIKQAELMLKREELGLKAEMERMRQDVVAIQNEAKNRTELEKAAMTQQAKAVESDIKVLQTELNARQEAQQAAIDQQKAMLDSWTTLEAKRMELADKDRMESEERGEEKELKVQQAIASTNDALTKAITSLSDRLDSIVEEMGKPRTIERDAKTGRPTSVGGKRISYNNDGTIRQIG
ncbi:MAG: hypothetical protein R3260_18480, partial [Pseudomonas sp.]|nr:hypothetical protein [Pseudomonas sp.]